MHDSPSSPRRSIAPAPPKQQQAKKAGAPKAKGAVRAKSGCYTCRIRRKKCDERPNAEGRCETCIRLRLQCLGFGQKRPDWLKENNNVTMFREKIKDFLAAQGMIKGHSGSGTRTSDQEGMLVLITDHGRSDTSSPHSPALSVDSSEDRRRSHTLSSIRHDPHYPSISLPAHAQHTHPGYSSQRMSFSSARESSPLNLPRLPSAYHHPLPDMADAREPLNSELILPFSPPPTSSTILPPPPNSLVSPMSQSWHLSNQNPYPSYSAPPTAPPPPVPTTTALVAAPPPPVTVPSQAPVQGSTHFTSTLPPSYQQQYVFEEEDYNEAEQSHPGYYIEHSLSHSIAPFISTHQSGLVRHYLAHVLQRQYLLADTSIADFIIRTVQQNPAVRDAVCLLATLHQESLRQGNHHRSSVTMGLVGAAATSAQHHQQSANNSHGAVVLTHVHNNNHGGGDNNDEVYADSSKTYKRICDNLRTSAAGGYTEGEAMAGLFVVSAFLFRGGRGAWRQFLAVAAEWVWTVLHTSVDPAETILRCSDSQQFVIKTTFWFDILASTTRLETPRFIGIYRKLWSRRAAAAGAYIVVEGGAAAATDRPSAESSSSSTMSCPCGIEGCAGGGSSCRESDPHARSALSMMSVMGCENATALAIAETSALACWKEAHVREGTLSVPELVDRGRAIEAEFLCRTPPLASSQQQQQQQQQQTQDYSSHAHHAQHHPHSQHAHAHLAQHVHSHSHQHQHPHPHQRQHPHAHQHHPHSDDILYTAAAPPNANLAEKRRLTADIFRATARVYLHSVLSGEHPGCPEIRDSVRETIECLQRVPPAGGSVGAGVGAGVAEGTTSSNINTSSGSGGSSTNGNVARSVLRSVVFGICLCGCLTDDEADREYLLRRLDAEEQAEGVGNCASARSVMQEVWNRRAAAAAAAANGGVGGDVPPLSWREATQQYGGESLLLV